MIKPPHQFDTCFPKKSNASPNLSVPVSNRDALVPCPSPVGGILYLGPLVLLPPLQLEATLHQTLQVKIPQVLRCHVQFGIGSHPNAMVITFTQTRYYLVGDTRARRESCVVSVYSLLVELLLLSYIVI